MKAAKINPKPYFFGSFYYSHTVSSLDKPKLEMMLNVLDLKNSLAQVWVREGGTVKVALLRPIRSTSYDCKP